MALITNNISGSGNPNARIGITGSLVIGDTSNFGNLSVGADTVFYVSGTRGGRNTTGTSVFGGDLIISGAIAAQDGIGGFSPIKLNTDVGLTGSLRLTKQDPNPAVTSDEVALFASGTGGATKLYFRVGTSTSEVASAGGGAVGSVGAIQFSNGSGGFSADENYLSFNSTTKTLSVANLAVTGTTTVVSTTNLRVSDAIILVASGAGTGPQKSAIAFASGSSVSNESLVFGPVGDSSNAFAAAKLDVQDGNLAVGSLNFNSLVPIKANHFQVGGTVAAVTSSNGASLGLSGSTVSVLAGEFGTIFNRDGVPFADLIKLSGGAAKLQGTPSTDVTIAAGTGAAALLLSGSSVTANAGASGFAVQRDGTTALTLTSVGNTATVTTSLASGLKVGSTNLSILSGSSVTLQHALAGALSLQSDGSSYLGITSGSFGSFGNTSQLKSASGKSLVLSGSTEVILGAGNFGGAAGHIAYVGSVGGRTGLFPAADKATQEFDLGGPTSRWANIYTGDLHLKNERGDYTLIEEENFLSIRFNKTGKRYKFLLEPVPELDEK